MTMPSILPDWMPWWAQLALLALALMFALALLMVPFAVFGLKGRLDLLEAQLDDIHAELRMLAMRLPDPEPPRRGRRAPAETDDHLAEPAIARRPVQADDRIRTLPAAERAGASQDGADRAGLDRQGSDRHSPDRHSPDRQGPDRHSPDRQGPDRNEPRLRWPPEPGGR